MNAIQLLAYYQKLQAKTPKLAVLSKETVDLKIDALQMNTEDKAWEYLLQFSPCQGWLGWQSEDQSFITDLPAKNKEYGVLLSGEMVNTKANESIQLRYNSAQTWHISHYRICPGKTFFCDTVRHIAFDKCLGSLCYQRFWKVDTLRGSAPWASCFMGYTLS